VFAFFGNLLKIFRASIVMCSLCSGKQGQLKTQDRSKYQQK